MKIALNLARIAVAACLAVSTTSAFAIFGIGDVVIDPTNLIQNTTSAIAAARNEINTANALVHQIRSAVNAAKSVAKMGDLGNLTRIEEASKLYNSLRSTDTAIEGNLGLIQSITQDMVSQYGASGDSWSQFLTSKSTVAVKHREDTRRRYEVVNAQLQDNAQRRQAIAQRLDGVDGQTQALQTLGSALDVIIGQNNQIISALQAKEQSQDFKDDYKNAEHVKSAKLINEQERRLREAANKF